MKQEAKVLLYTIEIGGKVYARFAWTGGDWPKKEDMSREFRKIRSAYFRDMVKNCGGLNFWTDCGTSAMDRARIFWNRSNGDAWRTLRRN